MADFTSEFWSWFIIAGTVLGIVSMFVLNRWMSGGPKEGGKPKPMGHVWDEDLQELNNPLPRWWLNMFYITLVFGIGYLALYPGLGSFAGLLKWSEVGEYNKEVEAADKKYGPLYEKYLNEDLRALSQNREAVKTGERLFVNYCTTCHGSDAGGGPGFPNLRDHDWLYGGDPQTVKASIVNGRTGVMPGWGAALGREGVFNVSEYVLSLSGRARNAEAAAGGREKFQQLCVACHGADGKGNPALGAPNLTDGIWLYGGSQRAVMESIEKGRQGRMPAHRDFLGEAKVHLLAAYVLSLSAEKPRKP
ncbi:MAG: cytochrome-c oxidase, cbb3-type subunit III [Candidatus Muproteobacteria bacterium RBG_16_64_11]|uniref:Cbb3-type cytochrome c oxidase subunit n=1 Tax=Candidatus Muproteobacteria bacterium RBG_16_64_11 TaxID=1817758 RepID=A0A1F6TE96_9PROT|nr:MAG: cytochrome-c oxidase, cbb3-type subunit III [Candidatus Muproteobacteria bacterium RBG_16_64_11]